MAIHESGQMYLETIYILSQNSTFVRAIDVGAQLGFTKPSVSRAMSILKKDGYVNVDADGAITLPFGTEYQMRWSLDMASTAFYVICAFKSGATCCVSSPPSVPAP